MKTRITNAKIACLDINLQKQRMQLGVQILVEDPNALEDIRRRSVTLLAASARADVAFSVSRRLRLNASRKF